MSLKLDKVGPQWIAPRFFSLVFFTSFFYTWHLPCDTWHITCYTWEVTYDMWQRYDSGEVGWMCCISHCKFGETVEHSVSSVLEASVSGVVFPRTTHVLCSHVFEKRVYSHPFPATFKNALSRTLYTFLSKWFFF